jgi:putative cell wall-binding protein
VALVAALLAALLLTSLAPALPVPVPVPGPVRVQASEQSHPVHGSHDFALPEGTSHVAVHWPGQPDAHLEAAFSTDGSAFGEPVHVELDEVGAHRDNGRTYGAVMAVGGARAVRVAVDRPMPEVSVLALGAEGEPVLTLGAGARTDASSAQPGVISRSAWGADESLRYDGGREIWPRAFYPAQKLVVHHTAGRNGDPNPAATVRAIYYYHAVTQGWGDIGYHYLVDEAGRVYEGRYSRDYAPGVAPTADDGQGRFVEAGHALGYNPGTLGISLLGTFTNVGPTAAAQRSLERMLAWASVRWGIDPRGSGTYVNPVSGKSLGVPNIGGHRDYNATSCPGGVLYARLPAIRNTVAAELVERFGGADRFATAASLSRRFFSRPSAVIVASGSTFADALSAGPAAAFLDAPLLLTYRDRLPDATRQEIARLRPQRILLAGGPGAVSDGVLSALNGMAPDGAQRIGGADRYETAAQLSRATFAEASHVFVANGGNFPDALAGAPAAAQLGAPLLLVRRDTIPQATLDELARLSPERIVVLGGAGVISSTVRDQLHARASQGAVRIGGADRYATAALVAGTYFPGADRALLANGTTWPDALSAGPVAARLNAPMLLARTAFLPSATAAELSRSRPMWVPVAGGPGAVSDGALAQVRSALGIR